MGTLKLDLDGVRSDRASRRVVSRWRELTGGSAVNDGDRRTLVACSGGADSVALVLMLIAAVGAAGGEIVVGHVLHDLRPASETKADRDLVAGLAAQLGLGFVEASVAVREQPGNAEGNARAARYRELERMAWEAGCPFVATAHHANDQVETMLMAMLRGAGIGGMAGMEPRRELGGSGGRGVALVRPMLEVGRTEAERVCRLAGVAWATDATNADTEKLRSGLRHGAVKAMEGLRPGGMERAAETAARLREVAGLVEELAAAFVAKADRKADGEGKTPPYSFSWLRADLVCEHPVVVSAALRQAYQELHGGKYADSLRARSVQRVLVAISEVTGGKRCFEWKGVEVVVGSEAVTLRRIST